MKYTYNEIDKPWYPEEFKLITMYQSLSQFLFHNNIIQSKWDGDQVTVKGVWTNEANAELDKQMNSKKHYIGLSGVNVRVGGNEAIQCLYSLTLLLPDSKHEKPTF